jgi:hypothetical protein
MRSFLRGLLVSTGVAGLLLAGGFGTATAQAQEQADAEQILTQLVQIIGGTANQENGCDAAQQVAFELSQLGLAVLGAPITQASGVACP